jgi:predicted PurR-regulated permease PerM
VTNPTDVLESTVVVEREPRRISPWLILTIGALVILWAARDVLGPFIVGGVIAYAFSQPVAAAQARTGWPRIVVIGLGYLVAIALIAVLVALIARQAVSEFTALAANGPDAIASTLRALVGSDTIDIFGHQIDVNSISAALEQNLNGMFASPGDAIHVATSAGTLLLDAFLSIVVSFYLLLDGPKLVARTITRVPADRRDRLSTVLTRIHTTMGRWLRGQLLLIFLVAIVVYVVLGPILNVPHSLAIAIATGVLEILPLVGPLVATVIAAAIAYSSGGLTVAIIVVVFYFIVRQVEDQVVMPLVIGRVVHLHPVVTIFAVLVGLSTYGILGGLLGVPVAAAVGVVFDEFFPAEQTPAAATVPEDSEPAPAPAGEAEA